MYHQVAEAVQDPWGLVVTPEHFAEHLQILRRDANPIGLPALVQAHQEGNIPDHAVAITFDDGYSDNFSNAAPLLEQYEVPATIFITTGYTGKNREFWWDELARILLQPKTLPPILALKLADESQIWQLGSAIDYSPEDMERDRAYKAWEAPPDSRLGFYYRVWAKLRILPDSQQQQAIAEIRAWSNDASTTRSAYRPMTTDEILKLDQGGLITIGAHTVTHPDLSAHSPSIQQAELHQSKQVLENWLDRPVPLFAYPFGDYASETVGIAQAVGFSCACTTGPGSIWRGSDRFQLPRHGVENWPREEFAQKLSQWFNS